jgi:hypothetical protein
LISAGGFRRAVFGGAVFRRAVFGGAAGLDGLTVAEIFGRFSAARGFRPKLGVQNRSKTGHLQTVQNRQNLEKGSFLGPKFQTRLRGAWLLSKSAKNTTFSFPKKHTFFSHLFSAAISS